MGWDIVFRRVSTKLEIHWNKPLITSYTKLAHEESKNRCFFKQKTRKQHIFNTSSKCYCCVSLNFPCLRWVIPTDFRSNFFWHRGMDWMGRWWKTLLFIWWCAYQDLLAVETSSQKKNIHHTSTTMQGKHMMLEKYRIMSFSIQTSLLLNHSLQKVTEILILN